MESYTAARSVYTAARTKHPNRWRAQSTDAPALVYLKIDIEHTEPTRTNKNQQELVDKDDNDIENTENRNWRPRSGF